MKGRLCLPADAPRRAARFARLALRLTLCAALFVPVNASMRCFQAAVAYSDATAAVSVQPKAVKVASARFGSAEVASAHAKSVEPSSSRLKAAEPSSSQPKSVEANAAHGQIFVDEPSDASLWSVSLNAVTADLRAYRIGGRMYVEAAKMFKAFGWVVFWNAAEPVIAANSRDGDLMTHALGTSEAVVNGVEVRFDGPSVTIGWTTYFPLSALESLLKPDSVIADDRKKTLRVYKSFMTYASHKLFASMLAQAAALENYDPLRYHDYLKYQRENPDVALDTAILYVNIGVGTPPYADISPVEEPGSVFAVVDKNHKFDDGFVPDLTLADGFLWAPEAGEAWLEMKAAAKAEGVALSLGNTYRSIAAQAANYGRKIRSGKSAASVDAFNSRPGHSEHHTGYTADMAGLNGFTSTKAQKWLAANGHRFGFIVSFQAGKEHINHYRPESWHIRWFPQWAAEVMYGEGLTLQEFDNLYLNPAKHGFSVNREAAGEIAGSDYSARNLSAKPTTASVDAGGGPIAVKAYAVGDGVFVGIRDLAAALSGSVMQFDVGWDKAANAVALTGGCPYGAASEELRVGYQSVEPAECSLSIDGAPVFLAGYEINGVNCFLVEDLLSRLGGAE